MGLGPVRDGGGDRDRMLSVSYAALRGEIGSLFSAIDDLNKQVSGLREGVAAAKGKLRGIMQEVQRRPQP